MNTAGYNGSIVLNNTTAITMVTTGGKAIRAVQAITDIAFTTLTDTLAKTNGATTQSVGADYGTVSAGTVLYGAFTAVTLSTGTAILYY